MRPVDDISSHPAEWADTLAGGGASGRILEQTMTTLEPAGIK